MQNPAHPPKLDAEAFDCPHCSAYAHMQWEYANCPSYFPSIGIRAASCAKCRKSSIWKISSDIGDGVRSGHLIFPALLPGPHPHPDLPDDCRQDYEEARAVFSLSPRASAALLRLCVQKLCIHLGEAGNRINDDIKSLVSKGLPLRVQQSLDAIRVTGNNAVHPGVMSPEDTKELTENLFELLNIIVEHQITQPKAIDALYSRIPANARDAITKRDGKA